MLIPTPKSLDKVTNSVRIAWAFRSLTKDSYAEKTVGSAYDGHRSSRVY